MESLWKGLARSPQTGFWGDKVMEKFCRCIDFDWSCRFSFVLLPSIAAKKKFAAEFVQSGTEAGKSKPEFSVRIVCRE
jgi:hypothetical protein